MLQPGTLDADALVVSEVTVRIVMGEPVVSAESVLVHTKTGRAMATSTIANLPGARAAAKEFLTAVSLAVAQELFSRTPGEKSTDPSPTDDGSIASHLGVDDKDVRQG